VSLIINLVLIILLWRLRSGSGKLTYAVSETYCISVIFSKHLKIDILEK